MPSYAVMAETLMPELATKRERATEGMRHGRDKRVGDKGEEKSETEE